MEVIPKSWTSLLAWSWLQISPTPSSDIRRPHFYPLGQEQGGWTGWSAGEHHLCKAPWRLSGTQEPWPEGWGQYSLPNRKGKPVVQDSHQLLRGLHLFSSTLHPLVLWSPDHRIKSQKSVSELPNVCMWRWGRGGGGRRSQFSTRKVNPAPPGNLGVYSSQAWSSFEGEIPPHLGHHEVYISGSLTPQFLDRNLHGNKGQGFLKDPPASTFQGGAATSPHTRSGQEDTTWTSFPRVYSPREMEKVSPGGR